jgi:DNA polymerase-3 subunit delta'
LEFKDIIGNYDVKEYLVKSIKNKNILHSYLFLGTEGIGKLAMAKQFAKKVLCLNHTEDEICTCKSCTCFNGKNHPDYYIINEAGESIKIDTIREITEKAFEKPILSDKKVYIINDFEKMTKEAQNCLLKTLEEPPEFVVIVIISSNENIILNTIKSRCMTIKFHNIEDKELLEYAKSQLGYENISENLLKSFDGSIGKAIKLKDNKENYDKIENLVLNLSNKDLVDIMLEGRILYDKENIQDILDYIIVCLYSKKNVNEKYINCIKYINECSSRLKSNSNFDMSIDNLLFKMWEELN